MEPTERSTRKIFGIGFHKTGTTSLGRALELLSYRVCGPVGYRKPDIATTMRETAFAVIDDYDAFQDNPWPLLFQDLDAAYPGSRFILTVRDSATWYASVLKHFGAESTPMREVIYGAGNGAPSGNEALYVARYERHNLDVIAHFRDRRDLLVMDMFAGDGWETLCGFLGAPMPSDRFPHLNIAPGSTTPNAMSRADVIREHGHLIGGLPYGKEQQ